MEVLGAAVGSILTCVCSNTRTSVSVQCGYLNNPTKDMKLLKEKKGELITHVQDVTTILQIAEEKGKTRTRDAQHWLKQSNDLIVEVDDLEKKASGARRCLNGILPNCGSRLNFRREISKLIKDVTRLLDKVDRFSNDSLVFLAPEMGIEMTTPRLVGKETAEKNLDMVLECLMNDEVNVIGVYGMGGSGKTTMMKNINNRILNQRIQFDKVIWVTVGKDANVHKLQNDIASAVGFDLSMEQDETRRASLLLKELRRRGNFLLILDDMWEAYPLYEIGIPDLISGNGCKLVLTTRSLDVCRKMECQLNVKMELLSEDESWKLFIECVGMKLSTETEKVAKDVCKECSRLPLAIVVIGGSMKGNDNLQEWRVALSDLRESTNYVVNIEEKVLSRLKFSYNRLGDDTIKSCFLHCACFPENFEINVEELIDHWVMEGLINARSIRDEVDRGHVVLNQLKRCCMLEDVAKDFDPRRYVKMHDLIRDMALRIFRLSPRIMVNAGVHIEDFPGEGRWDELEKASLVGTRLVMILIRPSAVGLTSLLLSHCPSLVHMTSEFFVNMRGLQVLDLSYNSEIESLPESMSNLVNLHVLNARWCSKLKRVPSLQKLQSLEVLRLGGTAIEELPHGMDQLVNLKCLDFTKTRELREEISDLIISKFTFLQELLVPSLRVSIDFVRVLARLGHLDNMSVSFSDLSAFIYYLGLEINTRLQYFYFCVGPSNPYFHPYDLLRRKTVTIVNGMPEIPNITLRLPQNVEELDLKGFNEVIRFTELTCLKDAKDLRECSVRGFSKMEFIMFEGENHLLQALEEVRICACPKLIGLYKGVAARGTFPCLKKLEISHCGSIKYLFSSMLLEQLHNLVELAVWNCQGLEEILIESREEETKICQSEGGKSNAISVAASGLRILNLHRLPKLKSLFSKRMSHHFQNLEDVTIAYCHEMVELIVYEGGVRCQGNSDIIFLPRLRTLTLDNLRKMKSIWMGELYCGSLQTVHVSRCSELNTLPQFSGEDQSPPPAMKAIIGSRGWWDSLQWDSPLAKNLLQPFVVHNNSDIVIDNLDEICHYEDVML